jgi:vacuolar-type H+-ATPase subunit E/Vma4
VSRAALIEDLRRKAVEDTEAVWREARAEAERCRLDAERQVEEQRKVLAKKVAAAARQFEEAANFEAARKSRELLAAASAELAERLHRLARTGLGRLREEGADGLFAALAAELPRRSWERVNPADRHRAQAWASQADVVCDAGVAGGLEVEAEEGRIRVSNTLDTRLDTAWPDILPGLVAGILAEYPDDRPAA